MPKKLYDFKKEDFGRLIASQKLDASKGVLFSAAGLQPNTVNRTIIIGIGGTGVQTVDYIKGAISKKLNASWSQYIAFLGIDTSGTEIDRAAYLIKYEETLCTTLSGVADRMASPGKYPAAVKRFMVPGAKVPNLNSDGAGRTRLAGKIKSHDKVSGSLGVDEEIVNRIRKIQSNFSPLSEGGKYEVYIIGSTCGGTGSGGLLELPSLIRTAIPNNVKVNPILYLPDTFQKKDPGRLNELYANGYATLKELNYFMGMADREGFSEVWTNNDPANPEIELQSNQAVGGFIDIPYLVGAPVSSVDPLQEAKDSIAEFLISLLANVHVAQGTPFLTEQVYSNALTHRADREFAPGNLRREASCAHHEQPNCYAAIGFAKASFPQKAIRAYAVGEVCTKSGLKPLQAGERAAMLAAGASDNTLIPFAGEDDLISAVDGTRQAEEILKPILPIIGMLQSGQFSVSDDLEVTLDSFKWEEINSGVYPAQWETLTNTKLRQRTGEDAMQGLQKWIREGFARYRENVQDYVVENGPLAFANLYKGRFAPVGEDHGIGISSMLENLVKGKTEKGAYADCKTVDEATSELTRALNAIKSTSPTLAEKLVGIDKLPKFKAQKNTFVAAYEAVQKARINEARRKAVLGSNGYLQKQFAEPAAVLAQEVESFGHLLVALAGAYNNMADRVRDNKQFREVRDNASELNLAAMNVSILDWIRNKADAAVNLVNQKQFRDDLIKDFFGNSAAWLEVPDKIVHTNENTGRVDLAVPDCAIPGRVKFDQFIAEKVPDADSLSVEDMFDQWAASGASFADIAMTIINNLMASSAPRIRATLPANCIYSYIMYPNALKNSTGSGPNIAQAIENAANAIRPGTQAYASDDADGIMFYQVAVPFQIGKIEVQSLQTWENNYKVRLSSPVSFLHGMSPDVTKTVSPAGDITYTEGYRWVEYPGLVGYDTDPRIPDSQTGIICDEGQRRLKVDALVRRARDVGALYSVQEPDGWLIKYATCNKSIQWNFDIMACTTDALGLLPLGKGFIESVASQNGKTLQSISATVKLNNCGVFDMHHNTEELAWQYAHGTLYAHMPMRIQLEKTVALLEPWTVEIIKFNEEVKKRFKPAQMAWMLQGRLIRTDGNGLWTVTLPDGTDKILVNLSKNMLSFLPPKEKYPAQNGMLGYYLFTKLEKVLVANGESMEAACNRAKAKHADMLAQGDLESLQSGMELLQMIEAEKTALAEQGARLDGSDGEVREKFKKAHPTMTAEQLQEVEQFYFRLGLWENI